MQFEKNMAIYRNDNLEIDGDTVKGKAKDVMEYLKYEIAHQCMSDIDYEELINNTREIIDLIAIMDNHIINDEQRIEVYQHPMGGLHYNELEDQDE